MRRTEDSHTMPNPVAAGAPRSYRRMYGAGHPTGPQPGHQHQHQHAHVERPSGPGYGRPESVDRRPRVAHASQEEEGVEVVLDRTGVKVVDSPVRGRRQDQNVFRPPPHPSHRQSPHAMRAPTHSHGHPSMQNSSSHGYAPPPPPPHRRGEYPPAHRPAPTQVPYTQSGSFEENYSGPVPSQHYSPQVHYPTPGRGYQAEDVNVISPNHKPDPYRTAMTPRSRQQQHAPPSQYYQYPPTSPVSRPNVNAPHSTSPPRKHYAPRRSAGPGEGPYAAAQRDAYHPDDGTFNAFPPPSSNGEHRPPLVAESSFDSENYASSHYSSHPQTPGAPPDARSQFYGAGSWASFDTAPPPPHFDDYRYYGYHPDSPYSHPQSQYSPNAPGEPAGYYGEPQPPHHPYDRPPYEEDEPGSLRDYHQDDPQSVTPNDKRHESDDAKHANGSILPKAASEIDFEVTAPPMEPIMPPSDHPMCDSPAAINSHDVLCGRGGGTNSQIGNRRFRQLVQDFQPTYLLARRKEKPLLARTIVLIIRNRGGRFLKKDEETGELYEVGDIKAEAKTSQALREGLDVRATKTAATSLVDKKKKKKGGKDDNEEDSKESLETSEDTPEQVESKQDSPIRDKTPPRTESAEVIKTPPPSPPPLPRLHPGDINKAGIVHPHSPEALQFRKRRRMRSGGCIPMDDKLFPDFCPPRSHLHRTSSPFVDDGDMGMATTPPHRNNGRQANAAEDYPEPQPGCAGIALSIMTGAATGSFCLGPSNWRRK
jgi:hypothetical protein